MGKRTMVEREQTRFLCAVSGELGYDAIGLGEKDLNYGLGFLREMIDAYGLPYTSANAFDGESGDSLLPRYLLVEKGGVMFGVASVISPDFKIISMSARDDAIRIDDPVATMRELIPEMRKAGAQTVLLLSHLGDTATESLLREVAGIDICLVGHTTRFYNSPRVFEKTILLAGSFEGRVIGRLKADIDGSGVVQSFEVAVTSLDDKIADDPALVERTQNLKQHLEEVRLSARGRFQPTLGSEDEKFLTENECRKCHEEIWDKLRSSDHSRAMAGLSIKGQSQNPECLVCHTTGYLYKNGYDSMVPYSRLANVQCEACHGYGTLHARDGEWGEKARNSCTTCHDQENSPEFDYATYWEKISH